jgi:ketosteroid isomerase-like protein
MEEALRESLREVYTAIQQGDFERLKGHLAHDVEWELPDTIPWGGVHHGHLGIESVYESYTEHVDGVWADPDEFFDAGDSVIVLGRVSGTARATGEHFEVPFAHVWGLEDGVPSRLRAYFDTASIIAALEGRPGTGP